MVTGCALGRDVSHWMFFKKVNLVQGQQDSPLNYDHRSAAFILRLSRSRIIYSHNGAEMYILSIKKL